MEGTNALGEVYCTSPKGKVDLEKTSGRSDPRDIGAVRRALVKRFLGLKLKTHI